MLAASDMVDVPGMLRGVLRVPGGCALQLQDTGDLTDHHQIDDEAEAR